MMEAQEIEWRRGMEKDAWIISWLTSPHLKRPLKVKKIFNYAQIISESKKSETERVEDLFATAEEKKAKRQESLKRKILRSAEREKNGSKAI